MTTKSSRHSLWRHPPKSKHLALENCMIIQYFFYTIFQKQHLPTQIDLSEFCRRITLEHPVPNTYIDQDEPLITPR